MTRRASRLIAFAATTFVSTLLSTSANAVPVDVLSVDVIVRNAPSHATFTPFGVSGVMPGDQIDLDLVARFEHYDYPLAASTYSISKISGSLISSNQWAASPMGTFTTNIAPEFRGPGWSNGTPADLDGDGDLDIGGIDPASPEGFFTAIANGAPVDVGPSMSVKIGTAQFTVGSLTSATAISYLIFSGRNAADAEVWAVNGQTVSEPGPAWFGNSPYVQAVPEPSAAVAAIAATLSFVSVRRRSA